VTDGQTTAIITARPLLKYGRIKIDEYITRNYEVLKLFSETRTIYAFVTHYQQNTVLRVTRDVV